MSIEIGAKIRQLRTQRSMTQEELGRALSVSAQAVSKWESGTNLPDIQLLPELSAAFGVSIDELFSVTDDSRMERIGNMIDNLRFMPEKDFLDAERFLKEKMLSDKTKPQATLLLATLYNKRAYEYMDMAKPVARQALVLNPDAKSAHNAIFFAEGCPCSDWNTNNFWELIDFYKDFIRVHPENPRSYLWLMDLLIHDGRTGELGPYLEAMDKLRHSMHRDLYLGLAAKEEGDLPRAMAHWQHMTEEFPDDWMVWACMGDQMAQLCRYDEAIECYRKATQTQPSPKYTDSSEAIAQISEIRGDYDTAIAMRRQCLEIIRTDWNVTEGESIDMNLREIARLREKKARSNA